MTKEKTPNQIQEQDELTKEGKDRREFLKETSKNFGKLATGSTVAYFLSKFSPFITTANAAELSNPEQQKLQEKFARICSELESYIKNSDKMPLQPIVEWSELMDLVKKQREANSLTADEKSRMNELQKKEREAMGKFVSVGTGPNSSEWKKLEKTTEKINKLTLVVIDTIIEAYALTKGVAPEAIKKEVWVKHPKEDRMVFNKAYFEKLAKDTNEDKNFARLLQTGGIVDELFKRYEMFFRMTDWKQCDERKLTTKIAQYGITRDSALDMELSNARAKQPSKSFNRNWNAINFKHLTPEESKQMVMNYRMSNLAHIHHLFNNLLFVELGVPDTVLKNAITEGKTYAEFSKEKLNYKPE